MDDHPERHHDESAHHAQPGHHAEPEQVNESGRDPDDDGGATEARGADLPEETTEEGCPPSAHITEVATDDLPDDDTLVELGGFAGLASALVSASWLARALAEGRAKLAHRVHCDRVTGALTTALTGMTVTPLGIGVEGELVEDRYRPSASLRALVQARDGTCRFPGCQRHARFCDLDHVRPWPGGPTAASNLMALCRRHHRIKQRPAWRVQLLPDGRARWFFPDGRTVLTHPVDHLAATRPFLLPTSTSPTDPGSDAPAAQRLRKTPCRTQEELDAEEPYGIDDHSPLLEHYLRRIADHQALPLREQTRLAANAQRRERERRLGTRHGPVEEITVDLGGQLIRWTPYWRHHVEEIPLPGASGSRSGPHASAQPVKPALLHLSYPLWNWDDPPF